MVILAEVSQTYIGLLFFAGLAVYLVTQLWLLVVAAMRGVLWLLGCILLPIVGLILVLVEPRARAPFLIGLLGIGAMAASVVMADDPETPEGSFFNRIVDAAKGEAGPSLEERKARIREWQGELEVNKAALRPGDAAAKAAFDAEFQQYMAELEDVKAGVKAEQR